eukprot:2568244-Pleurochrysis_carterae.AAC.5
MHQIDVFARNSAGSSARHSSAHSRSQLSLAASEPATCPPLLPMRHSAPRCVRASRTSSTPSALIHTACKMRLLRKTPCKETTWSRCDMLGSAHAPSMADSVTCGADDHMGLYCGGST